MFTKVCLLLLCCLSSQLHAQFWESTNGPAGGSIFSMIASPSGELFTFSNTRLRSTDRGVSWHQYPLNVPLSPGYPFQVHWAKSGAVFMLTQNTTNTKELWKSLDKGKTWTLNRTMLSYSGMVISKSGKMIISRYDSLDTSTDEGASWVASKPSGYISGGAILFSDRDGIIYNTSYSTGMYRSTDDGVTWSRILNGLPPISENILFASSRPGMVVLSSYSAIYTSSDKGRSWKVTHQAPDAIVGFCSASRDTMFSVSTQGAIERSLDGGLTWAAFSPAFSTTLYIVPRDLLLLGDELYITITGSIYKRNLKTQSDWQAVSIPTGTVISMTVTSSGSVYAITSLAFGSRTSKLWCFDSARWSEKKINIPTNSGVFDLYDVAVDSNGTLCATFEYYFIKSTDQGNSWKKTLFTLTNPSRIAATKDRLFAYSSLEGIFQSSDGGELWDFANNGITNTNINCIAASDGHAYAAGFQTFFRTTNDGVSWEEPIFPFISGSGIVTTIDAVSESVVLAANITGTYFSEDYGLTWKNHSTGLLLDTIYDLKITPKGNVLAATTSGVYEFSPQTKTWSNVNDGILNGPVYSLALGPDGKLYAGTKGNGVYRSTKNYGTWATRSVRPDLASGDIVLYPNPASAEVHLSFRSAPGTYNIRIFNLLGESILSAANTERIDVSSLGAGQYFVRIIAGGSTRTLPLCIAR